MTGTRGSTIKDAQQALDHVLSKVLVAGKESETRKALETAGVQDILEFLELTKDDLKTISWEVEGKIYRLGLTTQNKLMTIQSWFNSQPNPTMATWGDLTTKSLEDYRLVHLVQEEQKKQAPMPAPAPAPPLPLTVPLSNEELALKQFSSGVKRNISDYTEFKDSKQWFAWKRHTIAVGTTHGCAKVFDPMYQAISVAARQLFVHICGFMICVFTTKVKESTSLPMVRKYTDEPSAVHYNDAQLLFQDLLANQEDGV